VTISVSVAISVCSAHAKTRVMMAFSLARLIVPLQTITIENQSTSKLSKNPERWTSNIVRNINDLDVYVYVILFLPVAKPI